MRLYAILKYCPEAASYTDKDDFTWSAIPESWIHFNGRFFQSLERARTELDRLRKEKPEWKLVIVMHEFCLMDEKK